MKLKIGVHEFSPLTKKVGGVWSGFEIELWEEVAKRLSLDYEYIEVKKFNELLTKVKSGKCDLGIAGITRTVERSEDMTMSFLTIDTGLIVGVYPTRSIRFGVGYG